MRNNTKTKKANRKLQRKLSQVQKELETLRLIVEPIYRHSGNYNRWKKLFPDTISYTEAQEMLKRYFQEHPPENEIHTQYCLDLDAIGFEKAFSRMTARLSNEAAKD